MNGSNMIAVATPAQVHNIIVLNNQELVAI